VRILSVTQCGEGCHKLLTDHFQLLNKFISQSFFPLLHFYEYGIVAARVLALFLCFSGEHTIVMARNELTVRGYRNLHGTGVVGGVRCNPAGTRLSGREIFGSVCARLPSG
jgi:hypothetical protein